MACLFVGQLPFSKFFDADVYDLLEPYGKVLSVRMQHVKGEAFVYFDSVNSADAAIAALHGQRTLKGRQRPLQLFYASTSAEWSWFGILHNTRLHNFNPKVELPPFFCKKPPLAASQWSFVPHVTSEATELVLPATLQAMEATTAQVECDGDCDEQKSSTSSLRTTTSSSSLYSHDSSGNSSSGRAGNACHPPSPPQCHSNNSSSNNTSSASKASSTASSRSPRTGSKRTRQLQQQTLYAHHGRHRHSSTSSEKELVAAAASADALLSGAMPKLKVPKLASTTTAPLQLTDEEQARSAARARHRTARSHRKTKLRIEDEENFAVLDEEREDFHQGSYKAVEERGEVQLPSSQVQPQQMSRTAVTIASGGSEATDVKSKPECHHAATSAPAAIAATTAAPFLIRATAPFTESLNTLEKQQQQSTVSASPNHSTTFSSPSEADIVGTKNVVIRRRLTKGVGSGSTASLSSTPYPSSLTAPASSVTGLAQPVSLTSRVDAAAGRAVCCGVIPHHFHHHTLHSPHSSPPSLGTTPVISTTPRGCTSNELSLAADTTKATTAAAIETSGLLPPPSSVSLSHLCRPTRIPTPHHYHHHHRPHQPLQRGAVLPDETVRRGLRRGENTIDTKKSISGNCSDAVLGSAGGAVLEVPEHKVHISGEDSSSRPRAALNAAVLPFVPSNSASPAEEDATAVPRFISVDASQPVETGELWATGERPASNLPQRGRTAHDTKSGGAGGGGGDRSGRAYRQ